MYMHCFNTYICTVSIHIYALFHHSHGGSCSCLYLPCIYRVPTVFISLFFVTQQGRGISGVLARDRSRWLGRFLAGSVGVGVGVGVSVGVCDVWVWVGRWVCGWVWDLQYVAK